MKALEGFLRPEFINRVDEIIVFRQLKQKEIAEIAGKLLSELSERVAQQEISLTFSDDVIGLISEKGFDAIYGARPLKREIRKRIEDPLSEKILSGEIARGGNYECVTENGEIAFVSVKNE